MGEMGRVDRKEVGDFTDGYDGMPGGHEVTEYSN